MGASSESRSQLPDPGWPGRRRIASLPLPLLLVPFGGGMVAIEEYIVTRFSHRPERLIPPLPHPVSRPDHDLARLDFQLHLFTQPALFQQRLGDSDSLGVADRDDSRLHRDLRCLSFRDYNVSMRGTLQPTSTSGAEPRQSMRILTPPA